MPLLTEVVMTRYRFVSLCLVALLLLSVALPAIAAGPLVVPSGVTETVAEALDTFDRLLSWILGGDDSPPAGPYVVPAG